MCCIMHAYTIRVKKNSYPLVLRTSTILNFVVLNSRVLVQKVLLKTRNSKTIGHLMFFNHIISLVNCSWLKPRYDISNILTGLTTKARFLSQTELVKTNEMAAESRSESMRFTFMINKINFNSIVIWSRFSTVPVFFCIKNVLVPRTSYVKGLHVRTKFLPVPDNRTWVVAHPDYTGQLLRRHENHIR